jgi:hypothetical protein
MPDAKGWLREQDVALASASVSAQPAPKRVPSNPRLDTRRAFSSEAEQLRQKCSRYPEHQARIRELNQMVTATVMDGGSDWLDASKRLMDAMRIRAAKCN